MFLHYDLGESTERRVVIMVTGVIVLPASPGTRLRAG